MIRRQPGITVTLDCFFTILPLFILSACLSDDAPPPSTANQPPVSNAGPDRTVFEGAPVSLNGIGSDADGDTLSYSWTQTAGRTVTINNRSSASADFTAPNVAAGSPETLSFQLEVNDGQASRSDTVSITVEENEPPIANAGPDRDVIATTPVALDGTNSSDPNASDALTYAWSQTGGVAVGLTGSDSAVPTFTAPNVVPGSFEVLEFELVVSDGVNDDIDSVTITVTEGEPTVTISGIVSYEFVPPNVGCNGLNFVGTIVKPIRGATVQLIDVATGRAVHTTTSDQSGNYVFTDAIALTDVRLRVRAELKKSGSPGWDVDIRDNTSEISRSLSDRPLYAIDGAEFNTGRADRTRNLTATTGWDNVGMSYSGPRAAAPFAILDTIYSGMRLILTADPAAVFEPLDAFWSVNNTLVQGADNPDIGELSASYYTSNPDGGAANPSLFLLGDAGSDTEEFDSHVVAHEWGHYFEDNFSRSDSVGGPHALGQSLDARLAYGEGWATALAAMALDNPQYCDTGRPGTAEGFGINAESSSFGRQGWYNEISVTTFLYDLFDTRNDGTDTDSIGFQPIFETMVGPQLTTAAFTSVFSFAAELRPMLNAQQQAFLDSQLARENINPNGIDIWAGSENNDAGGNPDVLPLYTDLPTDGTPVTVCTNSDFDSDRGGNKLAELRFLRINVVTPGSYTVTVTTRPTTPALPPDDPTDDSDQSDPDIFIQRNGTIIAQGISANANTETLRTPFLSQDNYVAELQEFRFIDASTAAGFPERVCFDVTMAL